MTIKTAVTQTFLREYSLPYVPLENGLQLQVLPNIHCLSRSKKHHYAAFIKDTGMLIVWEDDPSDIIRRVEGIEQRLVEMLWTLGDSDANLDEKLENEKGGPIVNVEEVSGDMNDPEMGAQKPRQTVIFQSFTVAASIVLILTTLSLGWRKMAIEIVVDKTYTRAALLLAAPLLVSNKIFSSETQLTKAVLGWFLLLFCTGRWHLPHDRTCESTEVQHKLLQRHQISSNHRNPSTCDHPVPSVQGRP